jgi:hypothetical protein
VSDIYPDIENSTSKVPASALPVLYSPIRLVEELFWIEELSIITLTPLIERPVLPSVTFPSR